MAIYDAFKTEMCHSGVTGGLIYRDPNPRPKVYVLDQHPIVIGDTVATRVSRPLDMHVHTSLVKK